MSGKPKPKPGVNATIGPKGPANRPRGTAENQYMSQEFLNEYKNRGYFIEICIERLKYYGEDEAKLRKAYQDKSDFPPPNPNGAALTGSKSPRGAFIELLIERLANYGEDKEKLREAYQENNHLPPPNPHNAASVRSKSADKDIEIRCLTERNQELLKKMKKMERENENKTTDVEKLKRQCSDLKTEREKVIEEMNQLRTDISQNEKKSEMDMKKLQIENAKLIAKRYQDKSDLPPPNPNGAALTGSKSPRGAFIELLFERLANYGEDKEKLRKAYHENNHLPPPNPNRASPTGSKSADKDTQIKCLTERNKELFHKMDKLTRGLKEKVTEEMDQLQKDISENAKESEKEMRKLQRENAELIAKSEERRREIEQLKKEKADEMNVRLSKMAGAQVHVSVGSDPNSPFSLGEKFSELYDNEWTDAFEEMWDTISDEKKVIKQLLDIVFDAYRFCLDKSDEFMDKLKGILGGFSKDFGSSDMLPKEVARTNTDYRKSLAVYVVSYLQQDYVKAAKTKSKSRVGKATESYMKKCVSVCWFMTVQDPKVCITTDPPVIFDADQYKPYTKKGKYMDYLVWPAVYLHKGGPLLCKGVAQTKP